jgi:hypothetical protein
VNFVIGMVRVMHRNNGNPENGNAEYKLLSRHHGGRISLGRWRDRSAPPQGRHRGSSSGADTPHRPNIFRQPEVLTEAEVAGAEAENKALSRHALEVVEPKAGN